MLNQGYVYLQSKPIQNVATDVCCCSHDVEIKKQEEIKNYIQPQNPISNKIKKIKKKRYNKSLWTLEQNIKYCQFLQQNISFFQSTREDRRINKINKHISQFVESRSADQCRSHHQKMLKIHKNIPGIIQYIRTIEKTGADEDKDMSIPIRLRTKRNKIESVRVMKSIFFWDALKKTWVQSICKM